jgi:hypothetical protein
MTRVGAGQVDEIAHILAVDLRDLPELPIVKLLVYAPPTGPCSLEIMLRWVRPAAVVKNHPLVISALERLHGRGLKQTERVLSQSATFLLALRASEVCGRSHFLAYSERYRSSAAIELRSGALYAGYAIGALGSSEVFTLDGDKWRGSDDYAHIFDYAVGELFGDLTNREELIQRYYRESIPFFSRRLE